MKRWIILSLVVGLLVVAYLTANRSQPPAVRAQLVMPTNSLSRTVSLCVYTITAVFKPSACIVVGNSQ